jgi:WD40 repeat protein
VQFTADGNYLVSGGWDREIICWDLRTLQRAFTYAGKSYHHAWSADGRRCAIPLPNNILQLYSFELPASRSLSGNPGDSLHGGSFSPDGHWLVTRDDQQLCLWDVTTNAPASRLTVPRTVSTFFTADSAELFAIPAEYSQRGYMGRWSLKPATNDLSPPQVEALPVQFPKGLTWAAGISNEFITSSLDGLRLSARTNLAGGSAQTLAAAPWGGCVSPDGRWVALLYHFSSTISIHRLPDLKEVTRLSASNLVGFVTFSPDGHELLAIHRSGVDWYDTSTWQCSRQQIGAPVSGSYAFYTPDGAGIWMVTHFRNAALLDRRTLEPILPLPNDVLPLALSPDGTQLAVSVASRWVQLWNLTSLRGELTKLGLNW